MTIMDYRKLTCRWGAVCAALKAQNARLQAVVGQLQQRGEEQRVQNAALATRLERLESGAARAATLATH